MTPRTAHPVAPYLLIAELGAAVLGSTVASAEERITLEVIGAVRMAGPVAAGHADAVPVRAEAVSAREARAERSTDGMAARRN